MTIIAEIEQKDRIEGVLELLQEEVDHVTGSRFYNQHFKRFTCKKYHFQNQESTDRQFQNQLDLVLGSLFQML